MAAPQKVQCDYKHKIIDYFITSDGTPVTVWLIATKHSVKQYCTDTELPYKIGMRNLNEIEDDMHPMQQRDLNEIYTRRLEQ